MSTRRVLLNETALAELAAWRRAVKLLDGVRKARERGETADYEGAVAKVRVTQARVAGLLADACAIAFGHDLDALDGDLPDAK